MQLSLIIDGSLQASWWYFKNLGGVRGGSELKTDTASPNVLLMSKHDALKWECRCEVPSPYMATRGCPEMLVDVR